MGDCNCGHDHHHCHHDHYYYGGGSDGGGGGDLSLKTVLFCIVGMFIMIFVFSGLGITEDNVPSWLLTILVLICSFVIGALAAIFTNK